MNITLLEKVRCMLLSSSLKTATYLINRILSCANDFQIPKSLWSRKSPDYFKHKVFDCAAYSHQDEGKLDPKILIEYILIKIFLTFTAHFNLELDQLDRKTAFLNDLEEIIYMNQTMSLNKICLLKKSIYGLKQALGNGI